MHLCRPQLYLRVCGLLLPALEQTHLLGNATSASVAKSWMSEFSSLQALGLSGSSEVHARGGLSVQDRQRTDPAPHSLSSL